MKISSTHSKHCDFLFIAVIVASRISFAQAPATARTTSAASEAGQNRFLQDCAFCHGRDAQGGETGPDLTRSKLVADDVNGDKIGPVVRNGRPEKGMPRFTVSDPELVALATFLHQQKKLAESRQGGRRGVDVQDLQTGNVSAGKAYFNGAGTCSQCHSVTGDLAGIAKKYQGLKLEQNFLHPPNIKAKIELVDPSGQVVKGTIAYRDEFTIALIDSSGWYRSWPADRVKYKIDDPGEVHANLLEKYTDEDVHNVMAYLQTLQ